VLNLQLICSSFGIEMVDVYSLTTPPDQQHKKENNESDQHFAHAVAPVGAPSAAAVRLYGELRGYS
jgi:hypothetical protein